MSDAFSQPGVARQLDYCTFCPKMCRHVCPVANVSGRESFTPQAKMDRLNQLRLGHESWSEEASEPLYACTGCRQCTTACLHGNEPGLVLLAGRQAASAHGAGHRNLAGYPERFRGREARLVAQANEVVGRDRLEVTGPVAYFPGCDAVDKAPGEIAAALDLLDRAVAAPVGLACGEVACAGYPLLAAGHVDMFRWHATRVAAALKPYRTVVVGCSACVYTLRASYPAEGVMLSCEILSTAEALAQAVDRIPSPPTKSPVYYHDPCYLARYVGVIEPPRRALERVAEVRELTGSRTDTECCGGAGLLPKTMPEVADAMARERLRDVKNRGGGVVVTACSTCAFMLARNAPDGVEVAELASYVAARVREALGETESDIPPQAV